MQFGGLSLLAWLVIAWGAITSILVLLLVYRGMIGMHQEDQVFLSGAGKAFEAENAETEARLSRLRPYVRAVSLVSAVLAVAVAAIWVTQAMQRF